MEELIYSLQKGVIGRVWSHMCNDTNEPPRAGMGETALEWQREAGWGWDHVARGAKVRN